MNTASIAHGVLAGKRIEPLEALFLYRNSDLLELGCLADIIRQRLHPDPIVTYVIDRNINYTNICMSGCAFCAYWRPEHHTEAYVLTHKELADKIQETIALGGTQILLQGGMHPGLRLEFYEDMLRFIKDNFRIHCHGFSPSEVIAIARIEGLSIENVLERLHKAGLDSIPGGGAEILSDRVRKMLSPKKATADEWLSVMEIAHSMGIKTTATMMFGHVETEEERVEHLVKLRELQDRTGGFTAFIPWPFQPKNTKLAYVPASTGHDYLKLLSLSRIILDNIPNLQASWVTQGPKIAQVSLFFGANDFGSTMIEENVVAATGVSHRLSEQEIRRLITEAGFSPRQRRMDYSLVTI